MTHPLEAFDPPIGVAQTLAYDVRRIVAPNPSPMTYRGTNTYLVGTTDLAVIDPGPDHPSHLAAILGAVQPGQQITHIVVTHSHIDHSPLAAALARQTQCPILAFGDSGAGRSAAMQDLVDAGMTGGGEGIDPDFAPDQIVRDGARITGSDWQLEVIHTPGHLGNHIALAKQDVCFTGDHVMGWASSLVSPPDGDLTDFMTSCARLRARRWSQFLPGHGDVIDQPAARLDWLMSHRLSREAAILEALSVHPGTARTIAEQVYTETPPALLPAAERNVLAHLIDLKGKKQVEPMGSLRAETQFRRTNPDAD
ncbi:MAG: MBL fold metallo-hydrolase [Sedimentitalea sp.]